MPSHDHQGIKWPSGTGSPVEIKVFVPSTKNKRQPVSQAEFRRRVDSILRKLTNLFGSTTRVSGEGTYNYRKRPISESVVTVETFTDHETYRKNQSKLHSYLLEKKKAWGQDSIGLEFEGEMFFI